MTKLFFALTIIAVSTTVNAQDKKMRSGGKTFSIAANIGHATISDQKLHAAFDLIDGGDIQLDIPAATGFKITASAGYENFHCKVHIGSDTYRCRYDYIPLLGGMKFKLSTNLYGHGQLGYSISTIKDTKSGFTYAPSIGYMFRPNFDVSVKYISVVVPGTTFSVGNSSETHSLGGIVARLAYNF